MAAVRSAGTAVGAVAAPAGASERARAGVAVAGVKVMASGRTSDRANIAGRRRIGRDDIGAAPTIVGTGDHARAVRHAGIARADAAVTTSAARITNRQAATNEKNY